MSIIMLSITTFEFRLFLLWLPVELELIRFEIYDRPSKTLEKSMKISTTIRPPFHRFENQKTVELFYCVVDAK